MGENTEAQFFIFIDDVAFQIRVGAQIFVQDFIADEEFFQSLTNLFQTGVAGILFQNVVAAGCELIKHLAHIDNLLSKRGGAP